MTPQEALKKMDILNSKLSAVLSDFSDLAEAVNKALEKQISKEPKTLTYLPLVNSGWKYECPNCGCAVGKNENVDYEYLEEYEDYCTQCGQKLDWNYIEYDMYKK